MIKVPAGFTLIELLVVLVVVTSLGGLVGPNLWASYQRSSERAVIYDYTSELFSLRRGATDGLSFSVDELTEPNAEHFIPLPAGWALLDHSALYFMPSGVTSGAVFIFSAPSEQRWRLALRPLDGVSTIESL